MLFCRAKEGSELTVRGVAVRPDSTSSQAARNFPHRAGEDPRHREENDQHRS